MFVVGVDENGLGPRLGPLVVTGVSLSLGTYDARALGRRGRRLGIDDSKQTSAFGHMADAEGFALALIEQLTGRAPTSADEVLDAIGLDGPVALRAPCPTGAAVDQCWGESITLPAFGGNIAIARARLRRLTRAGIEIVRVRTAIACPSVLNAALAAGRNKLRVNLGLFERILMDARVASGEAFHAYCGMIGGIRRYTDFFSHFAEPVVIEEARDRAAYDVRDLGLVSFEVSADATHFPVALASMVGKYVRELAMARINGFYRREDPTLAEASGYHDPVTTRFIANTEPVRTRLRIATDCFQRER